MEITVASAQSERKMLLRCIHCDGAGVVEASVEQQTAAREAALAIWCRCGGRTTSHYVPDAPGCKHHWVCDDCNKVTQIG